MWGGAPWLPLVAGTKDQRIRGGHRGPPLTFHTSARHSFTNFNDAEFIQ